MKDYDSNYNSNEKNNNKHIRDNYYKEKEAPYSGEYDNKEIRYKDKKERNLDDSYSKNSQRKIYDERKQPNDSSKLIRKEREYNEQSRYNDRNADHSRHKYDKYDKYDKYGSRERYERNNRRRYRSRSQRSEDSYNNKKSFHNDNRSPRNSELSKSKYNKDNEMFYNKGTKSYIKLSGLPIQISENELLDLLNLAFSALLITKTMDNSIKALYKNEENLSHYCLMKGVNEVSNALKLEKIQILGREVNIERLNKKDEDFINEQKNEVLNTTSKIIISELPKDIKEMEISYLCSVFGEVDKVNLIYDPVSKSFCAKCIVEFIDEEAVNKAIKYINGLSLRNNTLTIRKLDAIEYQNLSILITRHKNYLANLNNKNGINNDSVNINNNKILQESKVISIKNMFTINDIEDTNAYEEILDMVSSECKNYGKVVSLKIPKPLVDIRVSGLGKAYVEYTTKNGSKFAKTNLEGKSGIQKLKVDYYPEDLYKKNILD